MKISKLNSECKYFSNTEVQNSRQKNVIQPIKINAIVIILIMLMLIIVMLTTLKIIFSNDIIIQNKEEEQKKKDINRIIDLPKKII